MNKLLHKVFAAALMCGLLSPSAFGAEFSPVGTWKTSTGESHFDIAYCGDGNKLCAKLIYLDAEAMKSPAGKRVGTYALTQADHAGPNVWRGPLTYEGHTATATLELTSNNTIKVSGCYLWILCKSYQLVRIR